jgi:hypothetical protein
MGSEMFRLTGNVTDAMTRVAAETSAYYLVSFEPESSERNGSSRRIELRVNRPDLKVRVQPELTIAKADNRSPTPRDMLRVATVYRDLPLRATANGLRNPEDDQVKLIALFQPVETGTSLRAAAIGLFDEKGKLVRQWTAQDSDLKSPLVTAALTAPPGAYRLRVAAVDGSGRAGTTDYEFRAEIVRADPLTMSSLILGVPQEGSFAPRLIYGPGDQAAVGMVEIYNAPKGGNVAATIELLPSEDGAAIATTDANVQQGGTEDFRIAFGGFGIDALPPGDVLMRFTVTLDGKPVGKVTRTLRKTGQ